MNIAELQKTSLQNEIYDHPLFASFTEHNKKQLMKKGHPNWSSISKQILLYRNDNSSITISSWNSTDMYTLLSQQAHTSYSALLHMSYHCSNFKKYDRSATLLQLYELTSSLINSYIQLFHIDHSIFTQDEINLLSEFYSLFSAKPNDFFTQKKPNI